MSHSFDSVSRSIFTFLSHIVLPPFIVTESICLLARRSGRRLRATGTSFAPALFETFCPCQTEKPRPEGRSFSVWQGQKDSNPQQRFWRPTCYHYTIPLCTWIVYHAAARLSTLLRNFSPQSINSRRMSWNCVPQRSISPSTASMPSGSCIQLSRVTSAPGAGQIKSSASGYSVW